MKNGECNNGVKVLSTSLSAILVTAMLPSIYTISLAGIAIAETGNCVGSDFNGDGLADLPLATPNEGISTATGTFGYAGAVSVLYGSASSGIQTSSPADQLWNQAKPGVNGDPNSYDEFGKALAFGDFNGDGYCDLAIGIPGDDFASTDAGAVNVLYGSSSGLRTTTAEDGTGRADQIWTQNSGGVDDVAESGATAGGDWFGRALAAGDFNSDGFCDLAIGVPSESLPGGVYTGAVNILYGSESGLQTGSPADQFWTLDSAGIEGDPHYDANFGSSMASGDFNNDGYHDLAIREGSSGYIHVLYGSSSGIQTASPAVQRWSLGGSSYSPLATGDFNGDGFSDLADGTPSVYVLYGSTSGLQDTSPAAQVWNLDGFALAPGDFNNDGYFDIAIRIPGADIPNKVNTGLVTVLYGSASGLQTSSPAEQSWTQNSPDVNDWSEAGDFFGSFVFSGDFNNDNYADLAIGALGEDIGTVEGAGAVHVLYGFSSGLQTSSPADQFWHQNSPGVDDVNEYYDRFASGQYTGVYDGF